MSQESNARMQESRLSMLAANALIDLARLVAKTYKSKYSNHASTTRLQQIAANATDSQLEALRIPKKFWAVLRKLDQVIRSFPFSFLQDADNYHIDLAAHLSPTLVNRTGRFRYSDVTASERTIAKKAYVSYLKDIQENATRLLKGVRATLKNPTTAGTPITTHQVVRETLWILPEGVPPTITAFRGCA